MGNAKYIIGGILLVGFGAGVWMWQSAEPIDISEVPEDQDVGAVAESELEEETEDVTETFTSVADRLPYDMTVSGRSITFDDATVAQTDRDDFAALPYEVAVGDETRLIEGDMAIESGESPVDFVERYISENIMSAEELDMYPDDIYEYSVSFYPLSDDELAEYPATDDPAGPEAAAGVSAYVQVMGIPDDSVGGRETRFDFIALAGGGWLMVWHGERVFCRRPDNEFWQSADQLCP